MGSKRLGDFRTRLKAHLQSSAVEDSPDSLTDGDLDEFVSEAVAEYSRFRPRHVVDVTLDGDGSTVEFQIDGLTVPYEDGFSAMLQVETPTGNDPPTIIDPNDYDVRRDDSGNVILYFQSAPDSGTNNIRLDFTARHTLSDSEWTGPDADFDAICHLAAAVAFGALAGKSAHLTEGNLAAQESGPRTVSDVYRAVARHHRDWFMGHLGVREGTPAASSHTREFDTSFAWGRDYLTHRRGWR